MQGCETAKAMFRFDKLANKNQNICVFCHWSIPGVHRVREILRKAQLLILLLLTGWPTLRHICVS